MQNKLYYQFPDRSFFFLALFLRRFFFFFFLLYFCCTNSMLTIYSGALCLPRYKLNRLFAVERNKTDILVGFFNWNKIRKSLLIHAGFESTSMYFSLLNVAHSNNFYCELVYIFEFLIPSSTYMEVIDDLPDKYGRNICRFNMKILQVL